MRVEDRDGEVRRAYGVTGEALVLVRPDNHIALVTPAAEPGPVHAYLARLGATG